MNRKRPISNNCQIKQGNHCSNSVAVSKTGSVCPSAGVKEKFRFSLVVDDVSVKRLIFRLPLFVRDTQGTVKLLNLQCSLWSLLRDTYKSFIRIVSYHKQRCICHYGNYGVIYQTGDTVFLLHFQIVRRLGGS